ncbi:SDR family oxidoreductase [Streptomyces sp. NPDC059785]|uniref:SDR family oxidoreductase n=1 Tax=Streptomyces sp. NPDC059785 TaxID=3346945 RepID=UPI00365AC77B
MRDHVPPARPRTDASRAEVPDSEVSRAELPPPPLTVLLTGAGGQVGAAVLRALTAAGCRVVALVHRTEVPGAAHGVRGDITRPSFGLPPERYRELARRTDAVVHCAADTDFRADTRRTMEVNVRGTDHVVAFAARAGARLVQLSSAFVVRSALVRRNAAAYAGAAAAPVSAYLESKTRAEQRVREAGVPSVVVRPSLVIGDARTGRVERVQGLLACLVAVGAGWLDRLPGTPGTRLDMVPSDYLARVVRAAVTDVRVRGDLWVTAGPLAPTYAQLMPLLGAFGLGGVELVDPVVCAERLASGPAGTAARRLTRQLLAQSTVLHGAEDFPPAEVRALGIEPLTAELISTAFVRTAGRLAEHHVPAGRAARRVPRPPGRATPPPRQETDTSWTSPFSPSSSSGC